MKKGANSRRFRRGHRREGGVWCKLHPKLRGDEQKTGYEA